MQQYQVPIRPSNQLHRKDRRQEGFTIVELMIASMIFSVVLLIIIYGIIRFSQDYYSGITQTNTQNVARLITQDISTAIQFDAGDVTAQQYDSSNGAYFSCAGDNRFSYLLGQQLVGSNPGTFQTLHGMVEDDAGGGCGGNGAQDLQGSTVIGTELLSPSMRIAYLNIAPVGNNTNLWNIDVRVVYGDNDLVCSPSEVAGSCSSTTTMNALSDYQTHDLQCKQDDSGFQFCAVSELNTTVQQRITQ
jgi:prepilin-type N-terminal cleavage/methylation domain-containing protein